LLRTYISKENDMGFARFMASPLGRGGRIVLGLALIALGIGIVGGVLGWVMAVAGLLPLTLGIINGCVLAPFLKVPFKGSDLPARRRA
jgi:hypothetical protein